MDNNTKSEVQYTDAVFSKDKKTRTRTNFKPTINRTTRKRRGTAGNTNTKTNVRNKENAVVSETTKELKENIEIKVENNNDAENKNIKKTTRKTRNSNTNKTTNKTRTTRKNKKDLVGAQEEVGFKKDHLKIIPLGGIQEIGKNITVFEYGNDIVIVDCGVSFPEDDMLGIDLVIPDFTYLVKNREKIRGLVITHGHEDHIGSIPYFIKELGDIPIYATKLTAGLIENKLEEHHLKEITRLKVVNQGQTIVLGKMRVEFIRSSHSIPDAVALAIHTPVGTVVHTGDFKIDYTPIDDARIDLGRLAELGNKGVLALLSDSTNSERKGYTMSESTVGEVFDKLFFNCKKRIVVATFASNVHRVQQIVDAAVENNRKIAVCGRSMINMIETAIELGYINVPKNVFIDIDMVKNYTDDQLVIITTGSQGEAMSALTRMANGEHKKVNITANDLVIISATPIPGNEKYVAKVIDDLMKIGAEVVYSALADVHVSGHACQEEQKLMLSLVRPKYFVPVHGEYRQLIAHSETAKSLGYDNKNIFLLTNGRILEMNQDEAKLTGTVPFGKVMVDGLGVGDVGNIVLRDRQHLSQDGLIIVVLTMDSATGEVIAGPDIISRGFVYVRESENLMDDVKSVIGYQVQKCVDEHITDWTSIKSTIKENLREYIYKTTKRNPMILPIIMEV